MNSTHQPLWELDLRGSLDGAGGVGGLLVVNSAANGAHFCAYDGNGNVTALVKAADGKPSAHYEYGPFGEALRVTGLMGNENPFRFSTKRANGTTDLVLYEYRVYTPSLGRWLSNDPIEEMGGKNLVRFVQNNAINSVDRYGQQTWGNYYDSHGNWNYPHGLPKPAVTSSHQCMPNALARSMGSYWKPRWAHTPIRTTWNDTAWYDQNWPGVVKAAKAKIRQQIVDQEASLCRGECLAVESFQHVGSYEMNYGDVPQNWWQTTVNIGDLEFRFAGFSRRNEVGDRIEWCASIVAVGIYGAQKQAPYFQGINKPGYYLFHFLAGPEREVVVGEWTICETTQCPCPMK